MTVYHHAKRASKKIHELIHTYSADEKSRFSDFGKVKSCSDEVAFVYCGIITKNSVEITNKITI